MAIEHVSRPATRPLTSVVQSIGTHIFNPDEDGAEHCQTGNISLMHQVAFDWLEQLFGALHCMPVRRSI